MEIVLQIPETLPDALQCTPEEFAHDAKMAMAVKLFEMKRISSGIAAQLAGIGRVEFLSQLHLYGAAMIDHSSAELEADLANA